MKTLEANVQYITTVSVNNKPVATRTNDGKLGISAFKAIAQDARKRDPEASITTERFVNGASDGEGVIMRYSKKNDAILLPKGRYHRVDTMNPTPEYKRPVKPIVLDVEVGDRVKLHVDESFETPCIDEVNENDVVLVRKKKGREIGRVTIPNKDMVKLDKAFRGANYETKIN